MTTSTDSDGPDRIESADGSLSITRDGEVRAAAIEHMAIEDPAPLTTDDLRCPIHGIPDCSPLLNGCRVPSIIAGRIHAVVERTRAADAFKAPEPHAYAVEVLTNPGTARAYWSIDDDFEPGEREDAEVSIDESVEAGYRRSHLRLVAITVVES